MDEAVAETTPAVPVRWDTMSTDELIELAKGLKPDADAALPVKMQWINNKLEISRLLLAKTDDEKAQKEATLYRLEALQNLSNLNRSYDLHHETVDSELYELSAANLRHPDPEIAKTAAVTIMLSAIHEYIVRPDTGTLKTALERAREFSHLLPDDDEIAAAIFQSAVSMKKNDFLIAGSVEFFQVVLESFQRSNNEHARRWAERAHAEILFGDQDRNERIAGLLIRGLANRLLRQHPYAEQEAGHRVTYALREDLLDQAGIDQIFAILETLLSDNRIQPLLDSIGVATQFFQKQENDLRFAAALSTLKDLEARVRRVNQTMDLSSLKNIDGSEEFQKGPTRPQLLVYWSPDNDASIRLISALYSQPLRHQIQVVAISSQVAADNRELPRKFAKEMPDFQFVEPAGKSESTSFQSQFPVSRLPYLALLDENNKLVAANPELQDLSRLVRDLLQP